VSEFVGQVVFGLAIGSIYSLVAIGFSMIFRATGLLHFAHPDLMMIGGMVGYTLATRTQAPMPVLFVLSGATVALLSAAIDRFGFRRLRRRGALLNLIIATIGWSIILVNVALFVWGTAPLSYPEPYLPKGTQVGGIVIVPQNVVMLAVGLLAMAALQAFFMRTGLGRALRATAENPVAAQLMGIRIERMMTVTFLLSGFLAGGAGVLVASIVYANFDLGLIGIKSFAAAVVGGFGHIGGAMAGGLLLGLVETMGAFYVSSAFKDVIAYTLLILVLLVRPHGLLGTGAGHPES
jgi:branched-chain amino acid transport system permease protein